MKTEAGHPDTLPTRLRVGIDVVDVSRLEERLRQWPRLLNRLFTERERTYASGRRYPAQHLAARFAAKEATFKALGSGWPTVSWHDVEVISDKGRPRLCLAGSAARLAANSEASVSLSHDGGLAMAQVVLVSNEGTSGRGRRLFPEPSPWRGPDPELEV